MSLPKTAFLLIVASFFAGGAHAQPCCTDDVSPVPTGHVTLGELAVVNAVTTGTLSLVHAWLSGNVESRSDAVLAFAGGAVGGLGFYEAKRLIATEHEVSGIALAHLSASLVRNIAHAENPLSLLCAGPGPVDVCFRTGLQRGQNPGLVVEANALAVGALVVLPMLGVRPAFRSGHLYYLTDRSLGTRGDFTRRGAAFGRTIVVHRHAPREIWAHEMIHAVQSMQIGAVTPYRHFSSFMPEASHGRGTQKVLSWDLQVDWLFLGVGAVTELAPYHRQWTELEAYRLTRTPVQPGPVLF